MRGISIHTFCTSSPAANTVTTVCFSLNTYIPRKCIKSSLNQIQKYAMQLYVRSTAHIAFQVIRTGLVTATEPRTVHFPFRVCLLFPVVHHHWFTQAQGLTVDRGHVCDFTMKATVLMNVWMRRRFAQSGMSGVGQCMFTAYPIARLLLIPGAIWPSNFPLRDLFVLSRVNSLLCGFC